VPDESRRSLHRTRVLFVIGGALALTAWLPWPQSGVVTRTELLRAEDARGKGPNGLQPLLDGLRVPALRRLAIRGIGRQEKPELIGHIVPYLSDGALAGTVAEALAQSLAGLPPDSSRSESQRALVDSVFRMLRDRSRLDASPANRAALARSIGRLPYSDARQARVADSVLISLVKPSLEASADFPVVSGVAQGLYTLTRARRTLGPLSPAAVAWLQSITSFGLDVATAPPIRRVAWLALTANGTVDRRAIAGAISEDRDPQVRRLAVAALPNVPDSAFRREQLARVARDREPMVRLEWVRIYRLLVAPTDCMPLAEAALADTNTHVRLAAIDALGSLPCPQRNLVLGHLYGLWLTDKDSARTARDSSGHVRAHAILAMARVDTTTWTRSLLAADAAHPDWLVRMYVARAAGVARDTVLLTKLAFDRIGNVREAAIQGLATTVGHVADLVYVRALASRDYHVVLAAARALRGAPAADSVRPALVDALLRLSREQRQTSRDPRMELLARMRELGKANDAVLLRPLLNDVDDEVANEAARVITQLTSSPTRSGGARPAPRLVTPPSGTIRVRVTMAASTGGGAFDLLLNADEAPMSAARIIDLIRRRYYDGLTFHRVVPNFVLQGGSPGMNEYVGDGPFMRDELGLSNHLRGTVGISTRGRDTGDAQWFINMVDNYRLDHDYTVVGTIVQGMDVVDRILEGDTIESVRVVP
jgi:cyclophilin family peptidyl-prolyl cis-trans isomerase